MDLRVNLKLQPMVNRSQMIGMLRAVSGVKSIVQTFPEEMDPDLAGLYILEISPSHSGRVLNILRRKDGVEYAEVSSPRKLIRR